jgi:hypothetical protein
MYNKIYNIFFDHPFEMGIEAHKTNFLPTSNKNRCYTVKKRPILKSSLMRQIAPLEYINTLLKRSIPKKPR